MGGCLAFRRGLPRSRAGGWVVRPGSLRARARPVQRQGPLRDVSRPTPLHGAREQLARTERDRRRRVSGGPLAYAHVPHRAAGGALDTSEGRVLSRRPLRDAARCGGPLRHVLQAEPQRPGEEGSYRIPEGALGGWGSAEKPQTAPALERSPAAVDVDGGIALPAARDAAVVEVDPADDTRGPREGNHAAARTPLEIESRSGGEHLAVPEGQPNVEHLEIAALHDDSDALEAALARGPHDIVVRAEVHLPLAEVSPSLLDGGRCPGVRRGEQGDPDDARGAAPRAGLQHDRTILRASASLAVDRVCHLGAFANDDQKATAATMMFATTTGSAWIRIPYAIHRRAARPCTRRSVTC